MTVVDFAADAYELPVQLALDQTAVVSRPPPRSRVVQVAFASAVAAVETRAIDPNCVERRTIAIVTPR